MKEYQVPPSSDKLPISLVKGKEDAYIVIHIPIQGYRYSQCVEFSFFNASDPRLHLDLRLESQSYDYRVERKRYFPPAHWHGSPNAAWMVHFYTRPGPYYSPDNTEFRYEVSTDGQTFPGNVLNYFIKHIMPGVSCSFDIDAVTYNYVGYDLFHGRAVTDAEKTATIAVFTSPTAKLEAQTYFARQLDHDVPSLSLKDIEARERAVIAQQDAVNSKEKALEEKEGKQNDREASLGEKEKMLGDRETTLGGRETALEDKEQILHAREVALEQKEGAPPQGGGTQPPQAKPASDIRPSDYDSIKVSATKAWPGIIKEVFGRDSLTEWMEKYHDFMRNWVEERGDDLPSNAYDYLAYAHGVAWPQILLQHTSDEEFVRVREKHAAFMRVLI